MTQTIALARQLVEEPYDEDLADRLHKQEATKAKRAEAQEWLRLGLNNAEVADLVGCCEDSARRWRAALGLPAVPFAGIAPGPRTLEIQRRLKDGQRPGDIVRALGTRKQEVYRVRTKVRPQ